MSTDREDQANSFLSQQQYFREYVQQQGDWELHEIYADEGISGTSTKKRVQFNRMISDAYEGKFQLIITKEVSRFSRNILDTISYTRELRAIGIGVLFTTDRINTLNPESEMLLSFLASLAQEESRRTSSRVIWGQTRQMERGVVFGQSLLGYDVRNGKISVNPEGAEIVRLIFRKYAVEKMGTSELARFLTEKGYRTCRGSAHWETGTIVKILKNEKYAGDLVQKKTYTPDFLTHKKRKNCGQVPLITISDHHEPIVSRDLWNLAQQRLRKNNKHNEDTQNYSDRYGFSGKIICGECGSNFVGRYQYKKHGDKIRRWSCSKATRQGASACNVGKLVRDDDAFHMLRTAIRNIPMDTKEIISSVVSLALDAMIYEKNEAEKEMKRTILELDRLQQKKELVIDSFFSGEITREDMKSMNRKYDLQKERVEQRQKEVAMIQHNKLDLTALRSNITAEVTGILLGETHSEVYCKNIVKSLTVYKDRHMELKLQFLPQIFHFTG